MSSLPSDDIGNEDAAVPESHEPPLWDELSVSPPGNEDGGPLVDESLLRQFHMNDPSLTEETRHTVAGYIARYAAWRHGIAKVAQEEMMRTRAKSDNGM